tara:strand:+ start:13404 stop:13613 length:210 start_codon:yes stop_codon:yes gene_type:complete
MTAKEKAKDLVDRFLNEQNDTEEISQAKQCALICVDEILKNQPYDIYTIDQCNNLTKYWKEVKQEIEKY